MTYTAQDEAHDLRAMLNDALAEIERLRRLAYPPVVVEVGGVPIETSAASVLENAPTWQWMWRKS